LRWVGHGSVFERCESKLTDELRGSIPFQATMRRLIYDMYYAEEISVDVAIKLLDKLEKIRDKRKRY
tara:strand:- start:256 stop:456 length:201 start_codon:yes stop_codon:yes gene_type:complete